MPSPKEIAYIAGILEGEGSFGLTGPKGYRTVPEIALKMSDFDVVEKVKRITKATQRIGTHKGTNKPMASLKISGILAAGWMMTIYSLMSKRRQVKIREVFAVWKTTSSSSAHRLRNWKGRLAI